jgi:hypothetical protein
MRFERLRTIEEWMKSAECRRKQMVCSEKLRNQHELDYTSETLQKPGVPFAAPDEYLAP